MCSGWVFFLIPLGGQAPHMLRAHMGHTCGEPNEIELTAAHGSFYRPVERYPPGEALVSNTQPLDYAERYATRAVQSHPDGGPFDFV